MRAIAGLLALVALLGCSDGAQTVQEPTVVMTDRRLVPLSANPDPERAAAETFAAIDQFARGRYAPVRLRFTNAPDSQIAVLRREAIRRGVSADNLVFATDAALKGAGGRATVEATTLVAVAPLCGKRILSSYTFSDTRPDPRLGCANAVALAEQVADPGDLVSGSQGGPFPSEILMVEAQR
jgi:type IV pilus biogenesis protein CpaD/CtpE